MPTQDSAIPNTPLTGAELKAVCLRHVRELMSQAEVELIAAIEDRMSRDQLFSAAPYTHPRARVKVNFEFIWSNRNLPETKLSVGAGDPADYATADTVFISATKREIEIQSPNLERMAAGLPINQVESVKPKPGEMFGSFKTNAVPVNPEEYPKPNPPKDEDITEFVADDLKVTGPTRLRKVKKQRGGPKQ